MTSINRRDQFVQADFDTIWYRSDWNDDGVIDAEESKSLVKGVLFRLNRLDDDNDSFDDPDDE